MIVSLNEIAATAQKATIGSGHQFGTAEEMGFATRWLCEHGLRGTEKLIHALEQFKPTPLTVENNADDIVISSDSELPISSITLAPTIVELMIAHRGAGKSVSINAVAHPLLLLPFFTRANEAAFIRWATIDERSVTAEFNQQGVQIFADDPFLLIQARADKVHCGWGSSGADDPPLYTAQQLETHRVAAIENGCTLIGAIWKKLQALAHNTYVPVSDASRLSGAGAGLTDND